MVCGLVFGMAGSPPVAERLHLSTFYFVNKQAEFLVPAIVVLVVDVLPVAAPCAPHGASSCSAAPWRSSSAPCCSASRSRARGAGSSAFSRRNSSSRPSSFSRPGPLRKAPAPDVPANMLAILILPATVVPLVLQPDFGQTMLISLVWGALFFMAGLALVLGRRHRRRRRDARSRAYKFVRTCVRASTVPRSAGDGAA